MGPTLTVPQILSWGPKEIGRYAVKFTLEFFKGFSQIAENQPFLDMNSLAFLSNGYKILLARHNTTNIIRFVKA